ncbi:cupin domain-containing protein [Aestuariirhabdus sp. Z084]|uniref:cupin domain-containing protein n=1 Tax=Aestuariirhabdus haliotis TaxID=2918751 RepID=UPI00201B37FD|nr:cupin domain-containing protein [Aestuariirhabdus haliotis]MCL6415393.1 cupin domain-containing protein [Aestuariirhabdus haliotis]MCL6419149.1 cupin domain-containing protein [Aestuariirhabdus haliotis]
MPVKAFIKPIFFNENAQRINKSLSDMAGPGYDTTEPHVHYFEEECVYLLEGEAEARLGEQRVSVKTGDFIGYPAGGEVHGLRNTGKGGLKCILVGQRHGP